MDYDQVLPRLLVGSYPENTRHIDRLRQEARITAVLSLQTDEDLQRLDVPWTRLEAHYRQSAVELRRVPVRDFDHDDLRRNLPECVEALSQLLAGGHAVYVHCTLGIGRSPSVVVAFLHWVQRWGLDKAVDHVNQCRPCSPNLEAIRLAGEDFFKDQDAGEQSQRAP